MNRRVAFFFAGVLVLLGASLGWFAFRASGAGARPAAPAGGSEVELTTQRVPVEPAEGESAPQPEGEALRDVAQGSSAQDVGDVTLEELADSELDVAQKTSVSGRVVDAEGQPVQATVFASTKRTHAALLLDAPANATRVRTTSTDAGRFEFANVDASSLRLAVRAAGFAPLDPPAIELPSGEPTQIGDLRVERGVTFDGL
ncbi:MAG TPA: carboxypeptidase-like regulatory domain-containing protein, partial [Planctomycetota bacterium]|nr:carboxypeptidase-like regulatory domain-containing protein [Planctomycetota bacterium]